MGIYFVEYSMLLLKSFLFLQIFLLLEGKSSKKGLCIPPGTNFHCGDLAAFKNASWWYNWHVTPNHDKTPPEDFCTCNTGSCGPPPSGKDFIPMIATVNADDRPWMDDINDPVDDQYKFILGFNEPERHDISPEDAARTWIEIQNRYPDKILVSPAPAGGKTSWFDPFFEACEVLGCRIDYLATHDYKGDVEEVMGHMELLYNRYGRKIWLTEFAKCCTKDQNEVVDFVKEIIPRLEAAEFVYKYSWFITRYNEKNFTGDWYLDPINALFEKDSSELSIVGQLYNSL